MSEREQRDENELPFEVVSPPDEPRVSLTSDGELTTDVHVPDTDVPLKDEIGELIVDTQHALASPEGRRVAFNRFLLPIITLIVAVVGILIIAFLLQQPAYRPAQQNQPPLGRTPSVFPRTPVATQVMNLLPIPRLLTSCDQWDLPAPPQIVVQTASSEFTRRNNIDTDLFLMDMQGSVVCQLTDNDVDDTAPSWSPDGQQIVFASVNQIYRIRWDGSQLQQLTTGETRNSEPEWSPDGRAIAYLSNARIVVINPDGTNVRQLTDDRRYIRTFAWSPDGERIAYTPGTLGSFAQVHVMNAEGTSLDVFTVDTGGARSLSWSPDGQYVAFGKPDGQYELVIFDTTTEETIVLESNLETDPRPVWASRDEVLFIVQWRTTAPPMLAWYSLRSRYSLPISPYLQISDFDVYVPPD